jgi:alkylation response protein AidB-like acyl-CoA dehydrogenase
VLVVEQGTKGFTVGKHENKMGIRWSDTVELIFDDCHVPAENLCGVGGQGWSIEMMALDLIRPGVAAMSQGLAQGAYDYALGYAKERIVFGKPIINHEALAFKLVDMLIEIEASRELLYKTCSILEQYPKDVTKRLPREAVRYSSMCKIFATDMAMKVSTEAVQILGGYGFMKDYPLEIRMRDAKIQQIWGGTNEINRIVVAGTIGAEGL